MLLGTGPEPERTRLERSGAPRSTYLTARRRAYDLGWVRDRFLPSPDLGFRGAAFVLARPFLEHRQELEDRWKASKGAVVLWRWPEHLFAVFLEPEAPLDRLAPSGRVPDDMGKVVVELACDLSRPRVPVYFDHEGAWSNFLDISRGRSYPRSLGLGERRRTEVSDGLKRSVAQLLARPFRSPSSNETPFRRFLGTGGLPRSQRRLLEKGWAEWRVFPDLKAIPPFEGRRLRRFVFVKGELRPRTDMEDLYHGLSESCRIAPFLLAGDDHRVLLGMLGSGEAPSSTSRTGSRRVNPVAATLQAHLTGIETVSGSFDDLEVVLDHRYDRLLPVA